MFKKAERLGRDQFDAFFKTGRRFHSEYATVIYAPHPTFHASVVVGKKVHKHAVTRNTLRRRIYAQLRSLKERRTGVFIVILKPTFKQLTRHGARDHIAALIERTEKSA
ncbi:MAG TPA: ribonuclease P protein component [Candidatus Paceibacterota bacterium]